MNFSIDASENYFQIIEYTCKCAGSICVSVDVNY